VSQSITKNVKTKNLREEYSFGKQTNKLTN